MTKPIVFESLIELPAPALSAFPPITDEMREAARARETAMINALRAST